MQKNMHVCICMYICIPQLAVSKAVRGCTCYINHNYWIIYVLVILIYSRSTSNFLRLGVSRSTALILERQRVSVRKGIQLKSDVQISESFENAPAQLFVAGPPSYRQLIGEYRRKTLTHTHNTHNKMLHAGYAKFYFCTSTLF